MRTQLSHKYIRGYGIEVGGRHCPLPILEGINVIYVDICEDPESKVKVIIDDAEELRQFNSDSLDFIIANHVLEHCHNPIGTISVWREKLKMGGIAFIALPDKEQTFDKPRPCTTLAHMIIDNHYDRRHGDIQHYGEWHYFIDGLRGKELEDRVAVDVEKNANIHFHVFDLSTMKLLFDYVSPLFKVLESVQNGAEVIWMLEAI